MENIEELCSTCSKPLPTIGFFCGACLTQFKCKNCGFILNKDYAGCTNCGTPKDTISNTNKTQTANTFRVHETTTETSTERTIEATFSDIVGKDLTGMLGQAFSIKMDKSSAIDASKRLSDLNGVDNEKSDDFDEHEVLNDDGAESESKSENRQPANQPSSNYPALKAVGMKNLPNSETEWIVVYAFYASNYGKEIFERKDFIEKSKEANRYNKETTNRDLGTFIKRAAIQEYINPLQNGYSILDKGINKAIEIVNRTSSSSPKISKVSKVSKSQDQTKEKDDSKAKKKSSGNSKNLKRYSNIDFYPKSKDSLEDFYKKYPSKNDNERNLLFVYYMQQILMLSGISFDHVYTCYDALGLRVSENLPQTVRNTGSRTGWIEIKKNDITVTIKGTNKLKAWTKP